MLVSISPTWLLYGYRDPPEVSECIVVTIVIRCGHHSEGGNHSEGGTTARVGPQRGWHNSEGGTTVEYALFTKPIGAQVLRERAQ